MRAEAKERAAKAKERAEELRRKAAEREAAMAAKASALLPCPSPLPRVPPDSRHSSHTRAVAVAVHSTSPLTQAAAEAEARAEAKAAEDARLAEQQASQEREREYARREGQSASSIYQRSAFVDDDMPIVIGSKAPPKRRGLFGRKSRA